MRTLSSQERYRLIRAYRHAVDQMLDVLDDRVENLYIASNPRVCAAIHELIEEAAGGKMTREEQDIRETIDDLRRVVAREKDPDVQQDMATQMRILIESLGP
jgi:hypothetical protein